MTLRRVVRPAVTPFTQGHTAVVRVTKDTGQLCQHHTNARGALFVLLSKVISAERVLCDAAILEILAQSVQRTSEAWLVSINRLKSLAAVQRIHQIEQRHGLARDAAALLAKVGAETARAGRDKHLGAIELESKGGCGMEARRAETIISSQE